MGRFWALCRFQNWSYSWSCHRHPPWPCPPRAPRQGPRGVWRGLGEPPLRDTRHGDTRLGRTMDGPGGGPGGATGAPCLRGEQDRPLWDPRPRASRPGGAQPTEQGGREGVTAVSPAGEPALPSPDTGRAPLARGSGHRGPPGWQRWTPGQGGPGGLQPLPPPPQVRGASPPPSPEQGGGGAGTGPVAQEAPPPPRVGGTLRVAVGPELRDRLGPGDRGPARGTRRHGHRAPLAVTGRGQWPGRSRWPGRSVWPRSPPLAGHKAAGLNRKGSFN